VGSRMPSTSKPMSFKKATKNNSTNLNVSNPSPIHSSYIVDYNEEMSLGEITASKLTHLHSLYEKYLIMCKFNRYWPPTSTLF